MIIKKSEKNPNGYRIEHLSKEEWLEIGIKAGFIPESKFPSSYQRPGAKTNYKKREEKKEREKFQFGKEMEKRRRRQNFVPDEKYLQNFKHMSPNQIEQSWESWDGMPA